MIPTGIGLAQSPEQVYFEETGHWVRGEFLKLYQSADDPLLLFGYPITDEITSTSGGATVQYFQRARMDLVQGPDGPVVQLASLGGFLYTPGAPLANISTNSAACRLFPKTGKSVCYAFLQFYDFHNGAVQFGNPISDLEMQDGRYVQYFERARMEWRPELSPGQRVALTDIGRIYYEAFGEHPSEMDLVWSEQIAAALVKPQVHSFVEKVLIPANGQQKLFIIAQDQRLKPVEGAMAMVVVTWPDGSQDIFRPNMTDANGISVLEFNVGNLGPKQVIQVDVSIIYQDSEAHTSTWFRTWW